MVKYLKITGEPFLKLGWFWKRLWKNRPKDQFSVKSKADFPKTEVLENPQM